MADEESLNKPNEQESSDDLSLDDLLASASGLAGGLAEDVGPPEESDDSSGGTEETKPTETIEEQLENVEDLLGDTAAQVGKEQETEQKPEEPQTSTPVAWPPKNAEAEPKAEQPEPSFSGGEGLGDLNDLDFDDANIPSFDDDDMGGGGSSGSSSNIFDTVGTNGPKVRWLGFRGLHHTIGDLFVMLLDCLDRPFMQVSFSTRQLLGYCAILTLLSAVVAYILAIMQ